MKRIGVFVDITHQFKAAQEMHGKKINYEKYLTHVRNGHNLFYAYAYGAQLKAEADGFIRRLRTLGYEPKYRTATEVGLDGKIDLDLTDFIAEIIVDVMRSAERLDKVILGTNDKRFIPLIRYLRERGIEVKICACMIPSELINAANASEEILDEILDKGKI